MLWNGVKRVALGTGELGLRPDREASYRLLDAFLDLGGEIIDTAAVYSDWVPGEIGRSETVIGEWLVARGTRDRIKLVTKGAHPPLDDLHKSRLDAQSIRRDVEASLRRLRTHRIDLYLLHRDDRNRPVAEIMGVLAELVARGDVAAVGCSNWEPDRIAEARRIMGGSLAATQVLGNVLCQKMNPLQDDTLTKLDPAALRQARAEDLLLMLYTSQAKGALTKPAPPADYDNPHCRAAIGQLRALAAEAGIDAGVLNLAFLLQLSPSTVPIVGARTIGQLKQSLGAAEVRLDAPMIAAVAEISGLPL